MSMPERPITVLIAALGGEGGGVLTNWLIDAAKRCGFPVQSTSIPGVAQRTGSTTYYIEILPQPAQQLGGKRPVLALVPGIGDIDLVVASELLEASRALAGGFITRERTFVLSSTHRAYVMTEKMAMGDGRLDSERLLKAIETNANALLAFDMDAVARASGAMINAVMLGAIAGCGRLPIPIETFEAAIRGEGKATEANLRGFRAGLAASQNAPAQDAPARKRKSAAAEPLQQLESEIAAMPAAARDVLNEGVRRLAAYQDPAYARLYLDHLRPVVEMDTRWRENGRLLAEVARHLAVRMSYEDVIRVAQAKCDPQRFARIRAEKGIGPGDPYAVVDYLKPGIDELCSVLPPRLAGSLLRLAERRGWRGRVFLGMEVKSTAVLGYLRFWGLSKLRRFRRGTYRYAQERAAIENWLALVAQAGARSSELAREVAECARLIKGYGDTHERGNANFASIEARLIRPALAGRFSLQHAIDAIASARSAALLDPEGEALERALSEAERRRVRDVAAE